MIHIRAETENSHRHVEPSGRSSAGMAPQVPLNLLGTLLDTRFELRNVESGELLSATVVEGSLFPTSTPGVVALARELSTGEHQAMLFRVRVSRKER